MQKYYRHAYYHRLPVWCAVIVIASQYLAVCQLGYRLPEATLPGWGIAFLLAWLVTDFLNGLIHMYMDNNTRYHTLTGPLVAAFHLHHKQPQYRPRPILKVYFDETGGKFWLMGYMPVILALQKSGCLSVNAEFFFVMTGILSSVAELSHYWCHNARHNQPVIRTLQAFHILLPKTHHAHHHAKDNTHYAFLNGMTDPLINVIARSLCPGYKTRADRHAMAYCDRQTANR